MVTNLHRTCRYHPLVALEQTPGLFSLTGVSTQAPAGLAAAGLTNHTLRASKRIAHPNGQLFAVRVFSCPQCGYIELADGDF